MICDNCKEAPAIYGDGVIEALCSKCYWEKHKETSPITEQQAPLEEGMPHQTIPGLTSIIIPIYNNNYSLFHYTGNCIGSIREHTLKSDYELIIIDNGSPIQPPSLNSYYADKVIKNESNLGYTKAVNQGIRASFGEYIVLLNSDTQVFNLWLETLKEALNSYDLVMAHPMYSLTEPFARAEEARQVFEGTKQFDALARDFSCVMFKKSLLDEIGLFDEQFISWCSDADLFRRLDEAGKTYKVIDRVAIHHVSDATGYSMGEEGARIMDEDKKRYEEKWNKQHTLGVGSTGPSHSITPEDLVETIPLIPMSEEAIKNPLWSNKLVRVVNGGDAIYLIKNNIYHHIKSPEVLHRLGFEFGQEVSITAEEFKTYQKGEEINMNNVGRFG